MDSKYYDLIESALGNVLSEQGFAADIGVFSKDGARFSVAYNEEKSMFELHYAESSEGESPNDSILSSWLFDETHREKDAQVIAEDFCDEARKKLGIAKARTSGQRADIDLPGKSERKPGDALSMQGFTQQFLAYYPQYKDNYKDNIAQYGDFMYFDFFKRFGVEKLREVTAGNNRKTIDKMLGLFNEFYCQGDKAVGDIIVACIFAGAFYNDPEGFKSLDGYFEEYPFLKIAAAEAVKMAAKNKKLQEALKI